MNNKKYFSWPIALLAIFMSFTISCNDDFFDAEMGGRIDPSQHYNSSIDAELSHAGCYVFLQDIAEKMVLVDGLLSDQMDINGSADPDMIDINLHRLSVDNPYVDPSNFYKMIININEVLPNLAPIMQKDRDFDSTVYEGYKVSLITLRSWGYFTLAKLNGEVGLVDGNMSTIDPSKPPVYLSKNELIDQLIAELLPYYDEEDNVRRYMAMYQIDHYVLLGELYLEKGDYANAAKFLKFAIDGPAYSKLFMVNKDFQQKNWKNIFLDNEDRTETIHSLVPYNYKQSQKNMLEEWMHPNYNFMVKPTNYMINSFVNEVQQNDDMSDVFRGVGITYDTTAVGVPYINKYSIDQDVPHCADVILYRAADIHLLLAEALNRLGQTQSALALLNNGFKSMTGGTRPAEFTKWSSNIGVRGRAYLAPKTVPEGTANVMEYVEDLIIQERSMELAFEGKRWFDLIRIANRRGNPAYLADKVAAKFDNPATAAEIKNKLMTPANWYLPIPKVGTK